VEFEKTSLILSKPTAFVTGPGRCGSSTVARILHEDIGICMGHYLRTGDEQNPDGYYEDYLAHSMLELVLAHQKITPWHVNEFHKHVFKPHKRCKYWGFKSLSIAAFSPGALKFYNPQVLIRTKRPLELVVKSWQKHFLYKTGLEKPLEHFENIVTETEKHIDALEKEFPTITVNFETRLTDAQVEAILREGLIQHKILSLSD
jgi:hypothetical protein